MSCASQSAYRHIREYISRIAEYEPDIRAFAAYDAEDVHEQLSRIGETSEKTPLAGLALGVKDIIDALPYPTGSGSPLHRGTRPARDAAAVAQLRAAGAVVMGKTVTTEFAFFSPGPTRNPHDPARTPGGSSSGSAAAVAAGFIDAGLGSQTAASITRPASYCGVVGFKPSFGSYSLAGAGGLAPSFDTLGVLSKDVTTAAAIHSVLAGPVPAAPVSGAQPPLRIGLCQTPWWDQAQPATRDVMTLAEKAFSAGALVETIDLSAFAEGARLHAGIMAFEAAQTLAAELATQPEGLSPVLRAMLASGMKTDRADHRQNLRQAADLRDRIAGVFDRYDLLLAPAAPGEAPAGLDATGDPIFSRLWSLLHLPTITLPGFTGPAGMPVGIQLLAGLNQDEKLLSHALWAEKLLPVPARPPSLKKPEHLG
ncbi:amidase [Pseudogemmobacter humi]|uniref:Biuret hydrolase n=1 Tax=Pseudogemmobacter humi TaxID=2483812 RepID=A0A3P5XWS7_9RHOB|nr:amidase [Pseudogemmobacter humi]VDC33572.1 Biuret hydrolase [Pseudogemmobacter humi]